MEAEQRRMSEGCCKRWQAHHENRLAYERAMLANEGGTAADVEMVPGGFIGREQVHGVNKSPVTGKVVSVKLMRASGWRNDGPEKLTAVNVERLPEGAYRAPTPEELSEFLERTSKAKAEKKATAPKAPALINPTDADAEKLQAEWNRVAKGRHEKAKSYGEFPASTVWRMTQAEYSARSKGDYGTCNTSDISENLRIIRTNYLGSDSRDRVTVFKVRTGSPGVSSLSACRRVVVVTDKPQKPLPWVAAQIARGNQPQADEMRERLGELAEEMRACAGWKDRMSDDGRQLFRDAVYLGWCYSSSLTQFGFTDEGFRQLKDFEASNSGAGVLATV